MGWLKTDDPWVGEDKKKHLVAGIAIAMVVALACAFAWGWSAGAAAGLLASAVVGLAKEVWDKFNPPHNPSWKDAAVTAAGGLIGSTALLLTAWLMGALA